ncbi:response regulator [Chondromyces crocatus]|nr:response regulator [Chondromyces crocatus]
MKVSTAIIVGSDPYCARILEFALNRRRFNVIRAQRTLGLNGLLTAFRPELVLLERDMPDLDCAAVIGFLRARPETQDTRVVLYSRKDEPPLGDELTQCGADGHVAVAREVAVMDRELDPWLPLAP